MRGQVKIIAGILVAVGGVATGIYFASPETSATPTIPTAATPLRQARLGQPSPTTQKSFLKTIAPANATVSDLGAMPQGKTASAQWAVRGWAMADQVAELVSSDKPEDHDQAMRICRELLDARPTFLVGKAGDGAIRFLAARHMNRELVELANYAVSVHPEAINELAMLLRFKAAALADLGQTDAAVVAAKQYYNIAPLNRTDDAVRQLSDLLRRAGRDNADRLVTEHVAAKQYDGGTGDLSTPRQATAGVLASIDLSSAELDFEALDINRLPLSELNALIAQGTILLLEDRPAEAEPIFQSAYALAGTKDLTARAENIARAMRDTDGGVGRASAWLATSWPAGAKDDPRLTNAAPNVTSNTPRAGTIPHEIAAAGGASSVTVKWLADWEITVRAGGRASDEQVAAFEQALTATPLTCDACVRLTRAIGSIEFSNDSGRAPFAPVAGVAARAAITAGAKDIAADSSHRDVVLAHVSPLVGRLWRGGMRDAAAVESFYTMLASGQPVGIPDWTRGHLGRAEAIGRQNRPDEALAALAELSRQLPAADAPLRAKIQYDQAIVLYETGHFEQAIEPLQFAAKTEKFDDAPVALSLLTTALIQSGQVKDQAQLDARLRELLPGKNISSTQALAGGLPAKK